MKPMIVPREGRAWMTGVAWRTRAEAVWKPAQGGQRGRAEQQRLIRAARAPSAWRRLFHRKDHGCGRR